MTILDLAFELNICSPLSTDLTHISCYISWIWTNPPKDRRQSLSLLDISVSKRQSFFLIKAAFSMWSAATVDLPKNRPGDSEFNKPMLASGKHAIRPIQIPPTTSKTIQPPLDVPANTYQPRNLASQNVLFRQQKFTLGHKLQLRNIFIDSSSNLSSFEDTIVTLNNPPYISYESLF